jgi:hypothetical protein
MVHTLVVPTSIAVKVVRFAIYPSLLFFETNFARRGLFSPPGNPEIPQK